MEAGCESTEYRQQYQNNMNCIFHYPIQADKTKGFIAAAAIPLCRHFIHVFFQMLSTYSYYFYHLS